MKLKFSFFKKHLGHPIYTIRYTRHLFNPDFKSEVNFLSEEECFQEILNQRKSLIRLGDGEIGLLFGDSIEYQVYQKGLQKGIWKIIRNYQRKSKYILAVPRYIVESNDCLKKKNKLWIWLPFKIIFNYYFNHNIKYGDAHIFYKRNVFENKVIKHLQHKKIIIISHKKNLAKIKYWTVKNNCSIQKIVAPAKNALASLPEIKEKIDQIIKEEKNGQNILLLPAIGPASKILIYEYVQRGIQGCDLGKGLEHFFMPNKNFSYLE